MKNGIEIIKDERQRQIEIEGYDQERDKYYEAGELAYAAAVYAIPHNGRNIYAGSNGWSNLQRVLWPFFWHTFKPTPENRIKELAKAGALIAAEIDRLQNLE